MNILNTLLVITQTSLYLFTLFGSQGYSQTLPNSCPFKEFRCSDGSACLLSEKLCNGIEDCPGGEDENGNSQWDCSLTTLSTECSSAEFRCRFGGCIPKKALCDGVADCWGASDESTDLCRQRPTRRPLIPQQTPASISPNNKVTPIPREPDRITRRPVNPIQPTSDSRPPPTERPIRVTPSPGKLNPIRVTERPDIGNPILDNSPPPSSSEASPCEVLMPPDGAEISCSNENSPVSCTTATSPNGTFAHYKCQKYWDPPRTGSQVATRVCREGQWSRLNRNWRCSLQCGIAGVAASGFIVAGYDSIVGRWPWHVGLYQENPPNSGKFVFFCGGSLISRRSVLTAAHCITKSQTSEKQTDRIIAFMGKYNRTFNNDDNYVERREVMGMEIPEYYSPKYYEQDIAILWLDKEVQINERVRPVCLPDEDDQVEAGDYGTLAGWGRWEDRTYPEKLQMAELPVTTVPECRKSHSSLAALSRSTTFCAGYNNGTSACDGDSGGGLVFEESRRYFVQGVVSAGISSYGQGGGCDPKYYTVFTKVSKFRTWIDNILDQKEGLKTL